MQQPPTLGDQTRDRIVRFILRYTVKHGCAPTQREIEAELGKRPGFANYHIAILKAQGRVTAKPNAARTLAVVSL